MKIAIAILNWNGQKWLEKFLHNVVENSADAEVYVIDNDSTDDSVSYLKNHFPEVNLIINPENYGFAGGYNEGLKHIKADIYCLLNSDVEVTHGWLSPILKTFKNYPNIAALQPKILDFNRKEYFEFAGAGGGLMDNLGYPYCRGRIFDYIEKDNGQYNDLTKIFWASGCALFIRSQDFWRVEGFDARFFAHQEEIDLCWRLQNQGREIWYNGESTVYHVGGGTLTKESPRKTFLNIRNNLSMLLKNLPLSALLWVIPARLVLDGFAAVHLGFKEGFSHFWAVLRAHFGFYGLGVGSIKRRDSKQLTKYYQGRWIAFKYFLQQIYK